MSIFYIDTELGDDSLTNPLGWWKVAYTGGTGPAPAADELITGASSAQTAKLTVVVAPTSVLTISPSSISSYIMNKQ